MWATGTKAIPSVRKVACSRNGDYRSDYGAEKYSNYEEDFTGATVRLIFFRCEWKYGTAIMEWKSARSSRKKEKEIYVEVGRDA